MLTLCQEPCLVPLPSLATKLPFKPAYKALPVFFLERAHGFWCVLENRLLPHCICCPEPVCELNMGTFGLSIIQEAVRSPDLPLYQILSFKRQQAYSSAQ